MSEKPMTITELSDYWESLFNKSMSQINILKERIQALQNENATLKYRISLYNNSYGSHITRGINRSKSPLKRKLTQKVKRKNLKKKRKAK